MKQCIGLTKIIKWLSMFLLIMAMQACAICDVPHCYKVITIVNYYIESGLFCIVY